MIQPRRCHRRLLPFKVLSNGAEILTQSTKDDWGGTFRASTEVLKGHFYVKESSQQLVYHLVCDKKEIVYTATARFICSDLQRVPNAEGKELFSLPEHQHLDILDTLNGF